MSRSAFTLRLPEAERAALEILSKLEGRPMNQLLNEAVRNYLGQRRPPEIDMERMLAQLEEYRKRDPENKAAIQAFIEAEMMYDDPAEGIIVESKPNTMDPAQRRIRELLSV